MPLIFYFQGPSMKKISLILLLPFLLFADAGPGTKGDNYLFLKSRCRYSEAFQNLARQAASEKNPDELALDFFRMEEVLPGLEPAGTIPVLSELVKNEAIAKNFSARDHLRHILILQHLRSGNLPDAEKIHAALGFLPFDTLGPFPCTTPADFDKIRAPDKNPAARPASYNGRVPGITWFGVRPDRRGIISFGDLFENAGDSLFYLHTRIIIPSDGTFHMYLGKTGFCSVSVDNRTVFQNTRRHSFHHDQYHITLILGKGAHDILIRLSDSSARSDISVRLIDSDGKPLPCAAGDIKTEGNFISSGAASLSGDIENNSADDDTVFRSAFLLMASGLSDEHGHDVMDLLSKIDTKSPLFPHACYYSSLYPENPEQSAGNLLKCLDADPGNIEALRDLASLRMKNNFRQGAWELLRKLRDNPDARGVYLQGCSELFLREGWYTEALRHTEALALIDPGTGYGFQSRLYENLRSYPEAADSLEKCLAHDTWQAETLEHLADLYLRAGRSEKSVSILYRMITFFPARVSTRRELARILEIQGYHEEAMTVLASALSISPGNSRILEATGRLLHAGGRKNTALPYLKRALEWSPDNFSLRQYLDVLSGEGPGLDEYICNDNARALDRKHSINGHNVILLDETVLHLFGDGSTERTIRRVYSIGDTRDTENLRSLSIILDPALDIVENLDCSIIADGTRTRQKESYRQPLSDPESRLYYNLEALVLPLPFLKAGSIVDFRYTVKRSRDTGSDGTFSEKITRSGSWRTAQMNVVLSVPAGCKLSVHGRNIDMSKVRDTKTENRRVISVSLKDLPGITGEPGMPPAEEFHPSLYISTLNSWDDFVSWYRNLARGRDGIDEVMREDLKKILEPSDGPLVRTGKIYACVTGRIRYVGFEFGLGGIRPRPAVETYMTRMGDCKDTALVLLALLREAGINADLALVRTRDHGTGDFTVPHVGEFNHALVYVPEGPGIPSPFFLDGTVGSATIRELPANDMNIPAIIIKDSGFLFTSTESSFYDKNIQRVYNRIVISPDGSAVIDRQLVKTGPGALDARQDLENPDERERSLLEYWNSNYPGSLVNDFRVLQGLPDAPVEYRYTLTIPVYAGKADRAIVIPPFLSETGYYRSFCLRDSRIFPIEVEGHSLTEETTDIILPGGFTVASVPESGNYSGEDCDASFTFQAIPGGIRTISRITIKSDRIDPGRYPAFREFGRFVNRFETSKIVVIKKQ